MKHSIGTNIQQLRRAEALIIAEQLADAVGRQRRGRFQVGDRRRLSRIFC